MALHFAARLGGLLAAATQLLERGLRAQQESLARHGQRYPARMALEQRHAELGFQLAHAARECRLGQAQAAGGAAQAACPGNGDEIAKVMKFGHRSERVYARFRARQGQGISRRGRARGLRRA